MKNEKVRKFVKVDEKSVEKVKRTREARALCSLEVFFFFCKVRSDEL